MSDPRAGSTEHPFLAALNLVGTGSASDQSAHPERDDTVNGSDFVELSLPLLRIRSGFCCGDQRSLYNSQGILYPLRAPA
jgi:hypothetical protein